MSYLKYLVAASLVLSMTAGAEDNEFEEVESPTALKVESYNPTCDEVLDGQCGSPAKEARTSAASGASESGSSDSPAVGLDEAPSQVPSNEKTPEEKPVPEKKQAKKSAPKKSKKPKSKS